MRLDWGNVPAWVGAISLLLAFRIFLRDRATADRAQVDKIGVWWEIDRPLALHNQPRIETVKVRLLARNGSDLPVELRYVAWEIDTQWWLPDVALAHLEPEDPEYPGVWSLERGVKRDRLFTGPIRIPPEKTYQGDWQEHNIAHLAPENASQLDFTIEGVQCILRWCLITDNAGRRWRTRHSAGRRPRRVRWYSRRGVDYPYEWKHPLTMRLTRIRHDVNAKIHTWATNAVSTLRKPRESAEIPAAQQRWRPISNATKPRSNKDDGRELGK